MIISGGENIHPLEVEDVLARHPGCARSRSSARRTTAWASASSPASSPTATDRGRSSTPTASRPTTLARFKRPREYRFVDALPKSPSGKILRRLLRDEESDRVTAYDGFRVERDAERGVATITLDVPEKMNRVSMPARDQLRERLRGARRGRRRARRRPHAAPARAFTAGGDIAGFMAAQPEHVSRLAWNVAAPERCPKPVIARIARLLPRRRPRARARLRLPDRRGRRAARASPRSTLGMIPGSGGTQRLARLIGLGRAKDVVMRGRRIGAEEALALGPRHRGRARAELDGAVDALVDELRQLSPLALAHGQARAQPRATTARCIWASSSRASPTGCSARRTTSRGRRGVRREAQAAVPRRVISRARRDRRCLE